MRDLPSGTVTFLFTDIEGSTQLWEQHPVAMRCALARHDALLTAGIRQCGGAVIKSRGEGDSFFAVFASAHDAVAAACALQQTLLSEPWPVEGQAQGPGTGPTPSAPPSLRVRMALHAGEAELREGDYYGPAVIRCARLRGVAHGGQVLLSRAVWDRVREELPEGTSLRDLGSHRLKDLQQPEQIFQLLHPALPADFPPLRSLEAFAHNLPLQLTSFVGREAEMAEVKRLLGVGQAASLPEISDRQAASLPEISDRQAGSLPHSRLVTLTGSGGCGKTRLTLQVAADLVEAYPDGVWLVELAALSDPALVSQAVATALGVREEPSRPLIATLTDYLRSKSLLLLLDNCEHLLGECAQLAEGLLRACPNLCILASSREGLSIAGELTYQVPSLTVPDTRRQEVACHTPEALSQYEAVRLFLDRAVFSQPRFALTEQNAAVVVQVCQRLDGIPLAIELAAARVKALPVEQIATRLDDRFRLLTGGSRTALPRQQTLRALIDWSYDLLSEAERTLLRRLSVFAGGWTLEAAEAVCADADVGTEAPDRVPAERVQGRSPGLVGALSTSQGHPLWVPLHRADVLDLLTALVDKSLVVYEEQGEGRYRLLETMRQYARDRLLESGEGARVREQHREWFLALAEETDPGLGGTTHTAWLDRLEREHDNLRAALTWSEAQGEGDAGLRLGGALCWFWNVRAYLGEGREHLAGLLALPGAEARTALRTKALTGAGHLARQQGDYGAAQALLEESLAICRELGDRYGIAWSLNILGRTTHDQGNLEAARALLEESLAIFRELGDKYGIAWLLERLGVVACDQEDFEVARALLEEGLTIFRELEHKQGIAWSLQRLGRTIHGQGDYGTARALFEESLIMFRELGNLRGIAAALEELAALAVAQAHSERAALLFGTADGLRAVIRAPLPPADRAEYDRSIAALRTALGEPTFAAAWAEGRAMTLAQTVAYALEEEPSVDPMRHTVPY